MKLGSQTGSLVNHIHSIATRGQPVPTVGMGATILHWTDRSPGTIIEGIGGHGLRIGERDKHHDFSF